MEQSIIFDTYLRETEVKIVLKSRSISERKLNQNLTKKLFLSGQLISIQKLLFSLMFIKIVF